MTDPAPERRTVRLRPLLRWLAAALFVAAGANHFLNPAAYRAIVPPVLPAADALVAVSGACEVGGGLGLLVRPLRRAAGWGLIALLVAVFPANVYMAVSPGRVPGLSIPQWLLWLRLPLQAVLVAWVWFVALAPGTGGNAPDPDGVRASRDRDRDRERDRDRRRWQ